MYPQPHRAHHDQMVHGGINGKLQIAAALNAKMGKKLIIIYSNYSKLKYDEEIHRTNFDLL